MAASILAPQHVTATPYDAEIAKALEGPVRLGDAKFTCGVIEAILGGDGIVVHAGNSQEYSAQKEVN
jgi:hypothetical protein